MPRPIFIVGQYKCGSTWLLNILSAHPQVVGVAEIDIVRAVCDFEKSMPRLASVSERLHRVFDSSGWCTYLANGKWLYRDAVARLERGESLATMAVTGVEPQRFMNLPADVASTLYKNIKHASSYEEALDAFLDAVSANANGKSHVVLKAADQIAVFDTLQAWQPEARKIVITRDGRDAAISALHYAKLTRELDAPNQPKRDNYWDVLKAWAHRADLVADHARLGELKVIRYEDLTRDFAGTLSPLFRWLDLDDSPAVIRAIDAGTCFAAITGRTRGTEAKGFVRKGAVGEWIDMLSDAEKAEAWRIAAKQLHALGYTERGIQEDFPGILPGPPAVDAETVFTKRLAERVLPFGATAIIVGKGDDALVDLKGRTGWHFPRLIDGSYAGYYPADSAEAIAHLEDLRDQGGDFLVFPESARWWLDHYGEFRTHLESRYPRVTRRDDACVIFALRPDEANGNDAAGASAGDRVRTRYPRRPGTLVWRCNICGATAEGQLADLGREVVSCRRCRSIPRWRSVIYVLSMELFGTSLALPDFPHRPEIRGIGLSDWEGYAALLAAKVSYQNTYYHREPRLDITSMTSIDPALVGACDFVIASDVFEHVAPPVSRAFENLRALLKPDGVVIFTVPYGNAPSTTEHFPDLHRYELVETNGRYVLHNVTRSGVVQTFDALTFHGGPGSTLEMRQFSEAPLLEDLKRAGFANIRTYDACDFEHGVYWREAHSLPMALRVALGGPAA